MLFLLRVLKKMNETWGKMMQARIDHAMQMRKDVKDPFRSRNGYSWDFCVVFKIFNEDEVVNSDDPKRMSLKTILNKFADAGLETKMFFSVQKDEIYCKIRAPMSRLTKEADRLNFKMLLEPNVLANKLALGNEGRDVPPERQWAPIQLPPHSEETDIDAFDFIYGEFRKDMNINMYSRWPNDSILRGVDRLKLIQTIIAAPLPEGGCHIDVYRLIKNSSVLGFFALHDAVELRELEQAWLRFFQFPWRQNVDAVRNYFGEKVALQFVFLGHYTTWLISASFLGFIAWCNVADTGNDPSAPIIPYFAVSIAIWSTLVLEYWKRKEKTKAMKWGMVGFEADEQARPEFEGESGQHPVTGREPYQFFPREKFRFRIAVSVAVMTILIVIVLGVVAGIFILRIVLVRVKELVVLDIQTAVIIVSLINAIQIQVFNIIYGYVAVLLTSYENHRTDTEYEDALIAKTFIFQFVNSFSPLFYIAFVKPYIQTEDACLGSCMMELSTTLGTIFITRLATGSLTSVLVPYITNKMKIKAETKGVDPEDLTDVENGFLLQEFHVILGPFANYAGLAIQFGFATMFVAAYPLALCLALFNNYVDMRVEAWKMCQLNRRPEPRSVEDIGTWFTIFEIVSYVAVICNAAIVAFTGTNAINETWTARAWIMIVMSMGLIGVKYWVALLVTDEPPEVTIQLERNKYFVSKVYDNVPDESDEGLLQINTKIVKNYAVRINDDDPL